MTFLDLAKRRCSVRKFKKQQVEEEKLLKVLEAGRVAPSADNNQPLHFVVLREEKIKTRVVSNNSESRINYAPVII